MRAVSRFLAASIASGVFAARSSVVSTASARSLVSSSVSIAPDSLASEGSGVASDREVRAPTMRPPDHSSAVLVVGSAVGLVGVFPVDVGGFADSGALLLVVGGDVAVSVEVVGAFALVEVFSLEDGGTFTRVVGASVVVGAFVGGVSLVVGAVSRDGSVAGALESGAIAGVTDTSSREDVDSRVVSRGVGTSVIRVSRGASVVSAVVIILRGSSVAVGVFDVSGFVRASVAVIVGAVIVGAVIVGAVVVAGAMVVASLSRARSGVAIGGGTVPVARAARGRATGAASCGIGAATGGRLFATSSLVSVSAGPASSAAIAKLASTSSSLARSMPAASSARSGAKVCTNCHAPAPPPPRSCVTAPAIT